MTAVELYHAEKAAYIARNGTDGVALMPRRVIVPKRVKIEKKREARIQRRKMSLEAVERRKAYHREWYAKNREKRIAQGREYRQRNIANIAPSTGEHL